MTTKWIEIALYDHWGPQPHGIARVTQNLFLRSLEFSGYRYFYYCHKLDRFIVPDSLDRFTKYATGEKVYSANEVLDTKTLMQGISPGDRVLITGAGWGLKNYLRELKALKEGKSIRLACVIYDIIAVHSPQFFIQDFAQLVGSFQLELFKIADHFSCISKNTEDDVRKHLAFPNSQTTSVFRMGADFPDHTSSFLGVTPALPNKPFMLSVGTIEARKNHLLLYYLMRKLALTYGESCPNLVIVGRVGWLSADVLELIKRDPLVNEKIFILSDIDDTALELLYQDCMLTLYPSFYEGYGLPILESFARGKVCLCSSSSSMKEITPFSELSFDPYDPQGAFEVASRLITDPGRLADYENQIRQLDKFSWTWKDSFIELSSWFE